MKVHCSIDLGQNKTSHFSKAKAITQSLDTWKLQNISSNKMLQENTDLITF